MLLLVTPLSVPDDVASATVPPLDVRLLPFASFSWTVIVELLAPLATIELGLAVIVEADVDAPAAIDVKLELAPLTEPSSAVTV